ncbi:hypothetical protein CRYPA_1544 [uncultured Candidatus Thioglobus sp.]|nr:hypothetical protein CRYPA_1544 [uncultured Candidatus Thioglobus sp.]
MLVLSATWVQALPNPLKLDQAIKISAKKKSISTAAAT